MSVFDTLTGQLDVRAQLTRAAAEEKPTHAWLFTGSPGAGRSTAALAFAAALLCDQPDSAARGCGHCRSCQTVLSGSHADFLHFTTEKTTITIEEARDFVVKAQDRPAVGRWRVMLIEDADRMPERTSNVLLKAIEEPPPHTIWLLTAPSPADVLVTIRSRCRPVKLRLPSVADVAARLLANAQARGENLEPHQADFVACLAQGNLEVAHKLATDPEARKRRSTVVQMPITLRSIAAAMEAADDLIPIAEAEAEADAEAPSPLNGTSAGSGFVGTTWVAFFTSFDSPYTCDADETLNPDGIDSVTGFPPTEAASFALITVVTSVRPSFLTTV